MRISIDRNDLVSFPHMDGYITLQGKDSGSGRYEIKNIEIESSSVNLNSNNHVEFKVELRMFLEGKDLMKLIIENFVDQQLQSGLTARKKNIDSPDEAYLWTKDVLLTAITEEVVGGNNKAISMVMKSDYVLECIAENCSEALRRASNEVYAGLEFEFDSNIELDKNGSDDMDNWRLDFTIQFDGNEELEIDVE